MSTKDFRFDFQYDKEFKKQLLHSFLKSIEIHAKERIKLKGFEVRLCESVLGFRNIKITFPKKLPYAYCNVSYEYNVFN